MHHIWYSLVLRLCIDLNWGASLQHHSPFEGFLCMQIKEMCIGFLFQTIDYLCISHIFSFFLMRVEPLKCGTRLNEMISKMDAWLNFSSHEATWSGTKIRDSTNKIWEDNESWHCAHFWWIAQKYALKSWMQNMQSRNASDEKPNIIFEKPRIPQEIAHEFIHISIKRNVICNAQNISTHVNVNGSENIFLVSFWFVQSFVSIFFFSLFTQFSGLSSCNVIFVWKMWLDTNRQRV